MYVAFTDYKSAFDTVDRDKLWKTIEKNLNVVKKEKKKEKKVSILKAMSFSIQSCVR